jgi:hypothetical protein
MKKAGKSKKKRVAGGDIFYHNEPRELVRVIKSPKDHKGFGDLRGEITARPFVFVDGAVPQYALHSSPTYDMKITEDQYTYVRPSGLVITAGERSKAANLRVFVDIPTYAEFVAIVESKIDLYDDTAAESQGSQSLLEVCGQLPMFVNELPLIDQVVKDFGNILVVSPIVHCDIAGCGIEYANGRAKWCYRNKSVGNLAQMEALCRESYGSYNIPRALMAKYERRVRDYMRSYRMGVLTTDLEKMRAEIKTHRNMIDSYETFITTDTTDDPDVDIIITASSITAAINKALGAGHRRRVL